MARFDWRLIGEETLAYVADAAEVSTLAGGELRLSDGEAFAILDGDGLVMAVERENLADGLEWLKEAAARGRDFRVVFLATGQREVVRHMLFSDAEGAEMRGAVKLRFQAIPARCADLAAISVGSPLVANSDVEALLGREVEAPLAARVGGLRASELASDAGLVEALRAEATARVRDLSSRAGVKVTGLGLAWGVDPERISRMAAAAASHLEGEAVSAERRKGALREREERIKALHVAKAEASTGTREEESAPETEMFAEEGERMARAESSIEAELNEGVAAREDFAAPCSETPEEGGLSACLYQPVEPGEEVALQASAEDLEEPEPTAPEEGDVPEPGPEDYAFAANAEELTDPLEAVAGATDGDEMKDAPPIEGEFAERAECDAPDSEAAKPEAETAPFVSLAEKVVHAPGWKLYGEDTLACLVEEVEIPRLFRKDFELGADEAVTVLRGARCEDFIVRGIERTSGALTWISRLHGGGKELSVLWSRTSEFTLDLDVAGSDGEAEEVFGVVSIGCRVPALSAPGLMKLMDGRCALGHPDLADYLCERATGAFSEALAGETVSRSGHALLEHALKKSIERESRPLGLDVFSISFDWAVDEDSCARVDWGYRTRCEKSWRFSIERNLLDARRKIELLARRIENISAYLHLSDNAKPDLRKMLVRSAFGVEALGGAPPKRETAEAELKKTRGEIVALKDGLSMLVETGDLEIRRGAPHVESRYAPRVVTDEEEGFLADSFGDGGWEADVTIGGGGSGFSPLSAPRTETGFKMEEPRPNHGGGDHSVHVGGSGTKITVQTRCVHCMAPLRRESNTCGNCGRRV